MSWGRNIIFLLISAIYLSGCSIQLLKAQAVNYTPLLSVSFSGSLRPHDCSAATVGVFKNGVLQIPESQISVSLINTSAGITYYATLAACQFETTSITSVFLNPTSPSATVYLKTDSEGSYRLLAQTSAFDSEANQVTASFTSFNLAKGFNNFVSKTGLQSDGKIIVVGSFTTANSSRAAGITRLLTDGSVDTSFNGGAGFDFTGYSPQFGGLVIQSDDKIIAGGSFVGFDGVAAPFIVRLNSDGSRDTSFNVGTGFDNEVNSLALQPDGKILVGGSFTTFNGPAVNKLVRLQSNGTIDPSFTTTGTGFNSVVKALAVQSNGQIVVGGYFTNFNGTPTGYIARVNSNGTLDAAFVTASGSGADSFVNALALQSDGKIIIGGSFANYDSHAAQSIVRVNSNGSWDGTYTPAGFASVTCLAIQSDDKAVVGGGVFNFMTFGFDYGARLNLDGSKDSAFIVGSGTDQDINSINIQSNGQIVLGGQFSYYNGTGTNYFARLSSTGTLENNATKGKGYDNGVYTMATQSDGKIILGGNYSYFGNVNVNKISRLNTNGTLDTSFSIGTGFDAQVKAIVIQSDGKIIVGGSFSTFNGTSINQIARLNSDGTLDTSFVVGTGFNGTVEALALQADGKIIAGGSFTTYDGNSAYRIVRLNTNGTQDIPFTTGFGFDNYVTSLAIQADGKIVAGGGFTLFNAVNTTNRIARINTDGTPDLTLATGTGFDGTVLGVAIQSDGKILAVGSFISYDLALSVGIARISTLGVFDSTLSTGSGFDTAPHTVALQADGKILVGGNFTSYNSLSANLIVRLRSTGSKDNSFATGYGFSGFSAYVEKIFVQSDGKIITGGTLKSYDTTTINGIHRLTINGASD